MSWAEMFVTTNKAAEHLLFVLHNMLITRL